MSKSFKELFQSFLKFEESNNVFDLEYKGIYYWRLIRFDIFTMLFESAYSTKVGKVKENSLHTQLIGAFQIIKDEIRELFISNEDSVESAIFISARKYRINDKMTDVYFYDVIKKFDDKKQRLLILDSKRQNKLNVSTDTHIVKNKNRLMCEFIRAFMWRFHYIDWNYGGLKSNLVTIEKQLTQEYDIHFDISRLAKKRIAFFYILKKYYMNLFSQYKPKTIYCIAAGSNCALIDAAQTLGIKVIERQHGAANPYNADCVYPKGNIPYLPDSIELWGQYWIDTVRYADNQSVCIGANTILKELLKRKCINKIHNSFLWISSYPIGIELSKLAIKMKQNNPESIVIYKLHMGEFDLWKQEYPQLLSMVESGEIQLCKDGETVYELADKCEFAIGVNSTSLYEAMILGCKVLVAPLFGYEYVEDLLNKGYAFFLPEDLKISSFREIPFREVEKIEYFYA